MERILFIHGYGTPQASVVVLSLGLGIGMVALLFGFHPAIGAYMCGLIIEEKYFDLPPADEAPDAVLGGGQTATGRRTRSQISVRF